MKDNTSKIWKLNWKQRICLFLAFAASPFLYIEVRHAQLRRKMKEAAEKERFRYFKPEIHETLGKKETKVIWTLRDKPLTDEELEVFYKK